MVDPLGDKTVNAEINRAWHDSGADDQTDRPEEGGYIVENPDLSFAVDANGQVIAIGKREEVLKP